MEEPAGSGGRMRQRRRTRRAIVDAATALLVSGRTPSMAEVADAADVSRRTVYQYFPTQDQLLTEAVLAGLRPSFERPIELGQDDVEARVEALVETMWRLGAESEHLGRTMIRLTVGAQEHSPDPVLPRRGFNRIDWIEKALEPVRERLDEPRFERLVSALALCFGWEAFIVLKDVRGLDNREGKHISTWAARVLLRAALEEQADESRRSAVQSAASSGDRRPHAPSAKQRQ
jgi:AcrR family transcriptional regulator